LNEDKRRRILQSTLSASDIDSIRLSRARRGWSGVRLFDEPGSNNSLSSSVTTWGRGYTYCYRRSSVVCFVCLSLDHVCEPCKNGWTDLDAVLGPDLGGLKEPHIRWGDIRTGRGNFGVVQPVEKHWESLRVAA